MASGSNKRGQLGNPEWPQQLNEFTKMDPLPVEMDKVDRVLCSWHNTVLWTNGRTKVWICGDNKYGQLGQGETDYDMSAQF